MSEFEESPAPSVAQVLSTPQNYFPSEEVRPVQERAMNAWVRCMEKEKQFAVFELPTGSGKSLLSYAIGRWAGDFKLGGNDPGAYILTTQKTLQQQYLRDFASRGLVELKGRSNYRCDTHSTDCHHGGLLNAANKGLLAELDPDVDDYEEFKASHPCSCPECPYMMAKGRFIDAPLGITNFSYMLAESAYVKLLRPRSILIIDEAHNTETQLLSFVEIEITAQRCDQINCPLPPGIESGDTETARTWVLDVFMPKLNFAIDALREIAKQEADAEVRRRLLGRAAANSHFLSRLKLLADTEDRQDWFAHTDEKSGALKLRPLTARSIANPYLFKMGHKLLFLSATILDGKAFTRGLGLSGPTGGFLKTNSDFPVQNRLITIWPAGHMSFKYKEQTTPRLVRFIEKVLNKHEDEKGLIHTHSYSLNSAVVDYLSTTKHASRLIFHDTAPGSREAAVVKHMKSKKPSVLVSPSMTEGLDLPEDLSRFQIISKVPYPTLADPFVRARMNRDPDWMTWQTALSIVQATGRSIRSKDDFAATYILDSDIENFLARADSILPEWWKQALVFR